MGATEDVRYGNLDCEGAANLHRWEMKNGKKVLLGCCTTAVSSGALHQGNVSPFAIELGDGESRTVLMENVLRDEVLGPSTRFNCTMGKTKRTQFGEKQYGKVLSETEVFNEEIPSNHLRKTPMSIFICERAANQKVTCSSVHERFFESQGSNGLLGHRSRAVAPQQLRLGGKGIVFTRTTPLDLSDLQENFTRMYQEETLDEAEEEPEPNAFRDDVAEEVNAAERVELELSRTVKSVLLWSGELYPGCETEEIFPQVSPKSPLVLTPQLQAHDSGNVVQELTGCIPNTSPTPPTNPLSIFGSPYSRKSRRVDLGQRRLFHDGDEQNKPWTVESAIVQPNDRFECGQEYLATESHSGDGDSDAMSEDSASSQELHVACELGGQGGNSLLQQNFSSSLTTVHVDDTAGCPVLVYTASPAVDMHKPKGACNELLSVDTVHNQTAHMGEKHSEQFVHTEQGIAWTSEFQLSHDSKVAEDDKDGGRAQVSAVQSSEQAPNMTLCEPNMLKTTVQSQASDKETHLSIQIPAVLEVENEKDVATVDMPIDQHGEAQHSSQGHDQVEPNLCGDVVFESAPSNSGVTPMKQQKQRRRPYDRKKQYINPLEAGTRWQGGKRVSTRIKSKPLEWWKGERMLYGRVHASLPTLIGIKHLSSDVLSPVVRRQKLRRHDSQVWCYKVDSFVPEEYNEMIRLAAL
ncbi:unnamed protein product [Sphagnum troendelagicum]|uniref:Uncharacterized protein n=1 Tax=Sphagnum troendelagicum TaxID=128251 RepID=A0ABP0TES4_9BRYO